MADDLWLPGFEQTGRAPTAYPGTMVAGAPRRFVCHFTQGYSRNPAASAAGHPNPPHLWVCLPSHPYRPGWRGQVYPLNVSARALNHSPSDPETNKQGSIQVEIEGFSEDAHDLSRADLDFLADQVIGPACAATGVDMSVFIQGVGDPKLAAGRGSATRMSWNAWRTFNGICSHQNVPGNDHWDAGGLDLAYISARLTGAATAAAPTSRRDRPMYQFVNLTGGAEEIALFTDGTIRNSWETTPGTGEMAPYSQTVDGAFEALGAPVIVGDGANRQVWVPAVGAAAYGAIRFTLAYPGYGQWQLHKTDDLRRFLAAQPKNG